MFADPQSITIDATPVSLPRTSVGDHSASYTKDDETLTLKVNHQATKNGRVRRQVRLDVSKISADPFIAGQNREVAATAYLVVDEPTDGAFTNAELLSHVKGLLGWCTDANVNKVLAGES